MYTIHHSHVSPGKTSEEDCNNMNISTMPFRGIQFVLFWVYSVWNHTNLQWHKGNTFHLAVVFFLQIDARIVQPNVSNIPYTGVYGCARLYV